MYLFLLWQFNFFPFSQTNNKFRVLTLAPYQVCFPLILGRVPPKPILETTFYQPTIISFPDVGFVTGNRSFSHLYTIDQADKFTEIYISGDYFFLLEGLMRKGNAR